MQNRNDDAKVSAFIDAANLHKGIESLGWKLDYGRFRVWLYEKYGVTTAYLFIGYRPDRRYYYAELRRQGYLLIFKETMLTKKGKVKGNCDAELVLTAVDAYYRGRFSTAVLVSSDGDYACLVRFLRNRGAFFALLSPSNACSYLLRKLNIRLVYLDTQRKRLEYIPQKEKAPGRDGTPQGSSSS